MPEFGVNEHDDSRLSELGLSATTGKAKSQRKIGSRSARSSNQRKPMKAIQFPDPPVTPSVLIVDEDLGFIWWLGEILAKAGCRVVPAMTCQEATSAAKSMKLKIDLIFVNPALDGTSAMLESFRRTHMPVRVIEVPAGPT